MHTRFSVVLPGVDLMTGEGLAREVETVVGAQERLMNRFDGESPVAELNRRGALEAVKVPAPLWEIILNCRRHWERTCGAFDIAQAARSELYREAAARGTAPSGRALAVAGARCGFQQVELDGAARTVRFQTRGVQLDFGAIGKGIALEHACRALRRRGVRSAFLSFGESSIAVIGAHPSGRSWPVGVADLFEAGRSWHRFELRDGAMSTSGNRTDGGHIIDPRGGGLITGCRTLSVACSSAVDAEVLSTALLVAAEAERGALLKNYPGVEAVEIGYYPADSGLAGRIRWKHET